MLLETLEGNENSLIVYSRNVMNNDDNFRMILLKDHNRAVRKLFLYDISGLIKSKVNKNLIAYRLLTNQEHLTIKKSFLGCFIETTEGTELIYPDPIYAVKELEQISNQCYLQDLKFRIQQVGYTGKLVDDKIVFKEMFRFDLDSLEVQAQDDSVFVEALLKKEKEMPSGSGYLLSDVISEVNSNNLETADKPFGHKTGRKRRDKVSTGVSKWKSSISIFKSVTSLKKYITPKLKKKVILNFIKN